MNSKTTMNSKPHLNAILSAVALWIWLALCPGLARADYAGQVLALNPLDYWQLNVPSTSVAITNRGSAGSAANASFVAGASQSAAAGLQPPTYAGFPSGNNCVSNAAPNTSAVGISCGTAGNLSGTTDFTLMAWVRILTANIQANGVTILCQRDSSGSGYNGAYRFELNSAGKVALTAYNGVFEWGGTINSPGSVSDGNWHQIACVRASGAGIIYIDGVQVANVAGTAVSLVSSLGTYIGYNQRDGALSGSSYWGEFKGNLAQVAVFSTALTSTQITNLYSAAFIGTAATPTFSPSPGLYAGATAVTMTAESGSTVFYTTNGTTPNNTSANGGVGTGSATFTVPAASVLTIQTYATNSGKADSLAASGTYTTVPATSWTDTWTNLAGGSWATAVNWTNTVAPGVNLPAYGTDATADFSQLSLSSGLTVTLNGSWIAGTLLFDDKSGSANTWTLNTGTLTLATSTGTPIVSNNVATTLGCVLAGTNGLTKNGNGTLTFSGGNTYTGNTIINGGTLDAAEVTDYSHVWVGSSVTVNSGATFQVGDYFVTGFAQGIGGNTNRPANMVVNDGGSVSLGGYPTYIESLTMNGSGAVTGSGDLRVCANVAATSDASGAPSISFMGLVGGTYTDSGNAHTFTVNHGAGSSSTADLTVGAIDEATSAGATSLIKAGAGTMALTGANTYTGPTTVSNGTLEVTGTLGAGAVTVATNAALAGNSSGIGGAVTIQPGGSLIPTTVTTSNWLGTLTLSSTLALNGSVTFRISKDTGAAADEINGLASVTYGGKLIVTNITTDTNATPLAAGDTFNLFAASGHNGVFTSSVLPPLPAGLNWDLSGLSSGYIQVVNTTPTAIAPTFNPTAGGYVGAQTITISSINSTNSTTIYYSTDNATWSTQTSPATVVVPVNTNETLYAYATAAGYTQSATASATYGTITTPIWLNAGGGSWATGGNWSNNVPATGSGVTADISQLTLTANTTITLDSAPTVGQLLLADQGNAWSWTLASGSGGPLMLDAGTNAPVINVVNTNTTISAMLAGTNGFTKVGVGTLTLSGANTYTGSTVVSNGSLVCVQDNAGFNNSAFHGSLTVNGGATLVFSNNVTGWGGGLTTLNLNGGTVTGSGGLGSFSVIYNLTGGTITGAATLALGSYNSVDGAINSLASATTSVINNSQGVMLRGDSGQTDYTFTTASGITGSGVDLEIDVPVAERTGPCSLIKAGTGTLLLTATNTYTGMTTVSNGTLLVNGSLAAGGVTVNPGATLGGNGSIGGTTTVAGTLAPGHRANLGALAFGTLVQSTNQTVMKITKTGGVLTNDVVASPSISLAGSLVVTNITSDTNTLAAGDTFVLINTTALADMLTTVTLPNLDAGLGWSNSITTDGTIRIITTAAPPGTNAYLTNLVITATPVGGPLAFAYNTNSYAATEAYANNPVTVTATSADTNATVQFSFNGGAYGAASTNVGSLTTNLALNPPLNTVSVLVTAPDITSSNLYTVNVVRQPSLAGAVLTNSVSGTNLTLEWPVDHTGYRLMVQTNLGKGVSSNTNDWMEYVPTLTGTNQAVIPIVKTNKYEFYRIEYP